MLERPDRGESVGVCAKRNKSAAVETVARSKLDKYVYLRIYVSPLEMPIIGRLNGTISDLEWYLSLDSPIYVDCRIKRSYRAVRAVSSVTDEKPTDRFDEIVYTGASKCLIDPKEEKRQTRKDKRGGKHRKHCFYDPFQSH